MMSSFPLSGLIDWVDRSISVENREILLKFHFRYQLLFAEIEPLRGGLASPSSSILLTTLNSLWLMAYSLQLPAHSVSICSIQLSKAKAFI